MVVVSSFSLGFISLTTTRRTVLAVRFVVCEAGPVSNRADTAKRHLSDGVPRPVNELDEITDAIEVLKIPESGTMSADQVGRVLASFESQLMELNRELGGAASSNVRKLRRECERTEEEVHGLNSELSVVVKGESG